MENRKELITIQQMADFLDKEIKKGNGDKYIFVGEYFIGSETPNFDEHLHTDAIHVQDVIEYGDNTGDVINC